MIVADSDVLIDALRGREPAVRRIALEIQLGTLATTAVNAFELLSGGRTKKERRAVETLLGALPIFPLDEASGRAAAEIRLALERAGQGIGMADYLIAGVCVARSAILLTRNRSHFERVSGLVLATLESA
jgi:predicted nucleic acid-binding protein